MKWNKYRSQMSTEAINNNLNILIDLTFTNVNRLFVLAYQTAEAYEKVIDISENNEYTTCNLLDCDFFKKYYKLIAIDLSKQQVLQENEDLIQQFSFIGRLE